MEVEQGAMVFEGEHVDESVPTMKEQSVEAFRTALRKLIETSEGEKSSLAEKSMALINLRQSNRQICFDLKGIKKNVHAAKNALDKTELVRQNLLYERKHLQDTIVDTRNHPCLYLNVLTQSQYRSNDNDPEPSSAPMQVEPQAHGQILKTLSDELAQRKLLHEILKTKQESLELVKSRLVLKKKELERLADQIETINKSAEGFINSHHRILADLIQKPAKVSIEEPTNDMTMATSALKKLYTILQTFVAPKKDLFTVEHFDRILSEHASLFDDDLADEDSDTVSTPREEHGTDDSSYLASPVKTIRRSSSHSRFATHDDSTIDSSNRSFSFAHIQVAINRRNKPLPSMQIDNTGQAPEDAKDKEDRSNDESIQTSCVYFYMVAQEGPMVALFSDHKAGDEIDRVKSEQFLSTLPLPSELLETISSDTSESGHLAFKWLQIIAGLSTTEKPSLDATTILDQFLTAILNKLGH